MSPVYTTHSKNKRTLRIMNVVSKFRVSDGVGIVSLNPETNYCINDKETSKKHLHTFLTEFIAY